MAQISNLIATYGYAGIFFLLLMGVFGVPVPDETLLIFSGFLVSKGNLRLPYTIIFSTLGSMCGITVSFAVGRFGGFRLVKRFGRKIHITEERLDRVRNWFDRTGRWSLTFGYFLPGIRHLTAIVAGSARMDFHLFAIFAYAGAAIWTTSFILIGYFVGEDWQKIAESIQRHLILATIIVIVAAVILIVVVSLLKRKSASNSR
jgi:membrane protein DedA with SNARE-associated domain